MDPKTEEQVKKRRAKTSPSPLNIYQKMLLLGGLLTIFLVAGIAPRMASLLSVIVIGVIGATFLIFYWFKSNKRKGDLGEKVDVKEVETPLLPEEKGAAQQERVPPKGEDKAVNVQEIFPEEKKGVDFEEIPFEEPEEAAEPQGFPEEKEKMAYPPNFPAPEKGIDLDKNPLTLEEKEANIQELLSNLEDRVAHIEDVLLKLEQKAADMQAVLLRPEEKVDMQMILSKLEEKVNRT